MPVLPRDRGARTAGPRDDLSRTRLPPPAPVAHEEDLPGHRFIPRANENFYRRVRSGARPRSWPIFSPGADSSLRQRIVSRLRMLQSRPFGTAGEFVITRLSALQFFYRPPAGIRRQLPRGSRSERSGVGQLRHRIRRNGQENPFGRRLLGPGSGIERPACKSSSLVRRHAQRSARALHPARLPALKRERQAAPALILPLSGHTCARP